MLQPSFDVPQTVFGIAIKAHEAWNLAYVF